MGLIDEDYEEGGSSGGIATQQSQITYESWLPPDPIPQFDGPTMHQQLEMGNPLRQQFLASSWMPPPIRAPPLIRGPPPIRAPPPFKPPRPSTFGAGHFTSMQPETFRRVFEESGQKFMSLSPQTNVGDKKATNKKGKKKATNNVI